MSWCTEMDVRGAEASRGLSILSSRLLGSSPLASQAYRLLLMLLQLQLTSSAAAAEATAASAAGALSSMNVEDLLFHSVSHARNPYHHSLRVPVRVCVHERVCVR